MPIEMVNKIAKAIQSGKISKRMKSLVERMRKERPGITIRQIAEAIVAMIENKRKNRSAQGGDLFSAFGLWTQVDDNGGIELTSKEPFWLNIMGPNTALRTDFGSKFVDDVAMIDLFERLKKEPNKIVGHRNHRMKDEKARYDLNISDVKYEFDKGISVLMNPTDREIYQAFKTGKAKPSPEIGFSDEDLEEDYILHVGDFKGLGVMIEKDAVDPTLGPHNPDPNLALGGEQMTDEEKKFEEVINEAKEIFEKDPKKLLEEKDNIFEKIKGVSEEIPDDVSKELKAMFFDAFTKTQENPPEGGGNEGDEGDGKKEPPEGEPDEKERKIKELETQLSKTLASLKEIKTEGKKKEELLEEANKTLIEIEISKAKYPKEMIYRDGMTLEDVKAKIEEYDALEKFWKEGNPEKKIPPAFNVQRPEGDKEISPNKPLNDKQWEEVRERMKKLNLF